MKNRKINVWIRKLQCSNKLNIIKTEEMCRQNCKIVPAAYFFQYIGKYEAFCTLYGKQLRGKLYGNLKKLELRVFFCGKNKNYQIRFVH